MLTLAVVLDPERDTEVDVAVDEGIVVKVMKCNGLVEKDPMDW